jgi:hypothetical protein
MISQSVIHNSPSSPTFDYCLIISYETISYEVIVSTCWKTIMENNTGAARDRFWSQQLDQKSLTWPPLQQSLFIA